MRNTRLAHAAPKYRVSHIPWFGTPLRDTPKPGQSCFDQGWLQ